MTPESGVAHFRKTNAAMKQKQTPENPRVEQDEKANRSNRRTNSFFLGFLADLSI